jgi:hypothetical protein
LKDTAKAKAMMAELNDFANITPYSNQETYDAANFLLPYYKGAKELREQLMLVSDVSAGINAPFKEMAEKYARFKAQDMLHMQDVYELTGRGFNLDYLAQALGTGKENIEQFSKDGKIHFKDVEKAFRLATSEGEMFNKMTETASTTTSGRLSTALGTATYAASNLATKAFPIITNLINMTIPAIDWLSKFIEENENLATSFALLGAGATAAYPVIQFAKLVGGTGSTILSVSSSIIGFAKALSALRAAEAVGDVAGWYKAMEKYGAAGNLAAKALGWAKIEQIGFNAAALANPLVIGAAIFAAAGIGIAYYISKQHELTAAERTSIAVKEGVAKATRDEKAALSESVDNMSRMQQGSEDWKTSLARLKQAYGKYRTDIEWEKVTLKDLPVLYRKLAQGMDEVARAKVLADMKSETFRAEYDAQFEVSSLKAKGDNFFDTYGGGRRGLSGRLFGNQQKVYEAEQKLKGVVDNRTVIQSEMDRMAGKSNQSKDGWQSTTQKNGTQTINLVVDGKVLASVVHKAGRVENRTSFEQK